VIALLRCFVLAGCFALGTTGCQSTRTAAPDGTQPSSNADSLELPAFSKILRLGRPLREISGLAASPTKAGILWAVADSGNPPDLHAIRPDGSTAGRVRVEGARNRDWEDLAAFTYRGRSYLLVADVGDNRGRRRDCRLYFIPEPDPTAISCVPEVSCQIAYTDRPHDCEAVAVDVARDAIYLASKEEGRSRIYLTSLSGAFGGGVRTAKPVGLVPLELRGAPMGLGKLARHASFGQTACGMALDRTSGAAYLLSYTHLYRLTAGDLATNLAPGDRKLIAYPSLYQAESVAVPAWDRRGIWIASEGKAGGSLVRIPRR